MTKKEVNPQNSSINFKLKLVKRAVPKWNNSGKGLYEQLRGGNHVVYNSKDFTIEKLESVMKDFFYKKDKNEYRKKFSFGSKILKQTYKFG